jgi:hypothetical protein
MKSSAYLLTTTSTRRNHESGLFKITEAQRHDTLCIHNAPTIASSPCSPCHSCRHSPFHQHLSLVPAILMPTRHTRYSTPHPHNLPCKSRTRKRTHHLHKKSVLIVLATFISFPVHAISIIPPPSTSPFIYLATKPTHQQRRPSQLRQTHVPRADAAQEVKPI